MRFMPFLGLCLLVVTGWAQPRFAIEVEELDFKGPALHSGAWAQWQGDWLFIGGRTNGLHGFLPPLAFPASGINDSVVLFNPGSQQRWAISLDYLPDSIREPLTSSNLQFTQIDSILYVSGGYGYQASESDHRTFGTLAKISLPSLIADVKAGKQDKQWLRSFISDQRLKVCGGYLAHLDSVFMLVLGHRFDGVYDRDDEGGFFSQEYTHEVRRFGLKEDEGSLAISGYKASRNEAEYRRRDYNLLPDILADGTLSYKAFTGVFLKDALLPHLNAIDITASEDSVNQKLTQKLSHYHSAALAIYDSTRQEMHHAFFGGSALYWIDEESQTYQKDEQIPFVNTISVISRNKQGYSEHALSPRLPGLLGTNAYFIPNPALTAYPNSVLKLDEMPERVLLGHMVGGIESPEPNINLTDPALSWASDRLFAIWLDKGYVNVGYAKAETSSDKMKVSVTAQNQLKVRLSLSTPAKQLSMRVYGTQGRLLRALKPRAIQQGESTETINLTGLLQGQYILKVSDGQKELSQPFTISR